MSYRSKMKIEDIKEANKALQVKQTPLCSFVVVELVVSFRVAARCRAGRCGWKTRTRATASCVRKSSPSQDARWADSDHWRSFTHFGCLHHHRCCAFSITVGTAERSSATVARTTNFHCPHLPNRCECATPATLSSFRDARLIPLESISLYLLRKVHLFKAFACTCVAYLTGIVLDWFWKLRCWSGALRFLKEWPLLELDAVPRYIRKMTWPQSTTRAVQTWYL